MIAKDLQSGFSLLPAHLGRFLDSLPGVTIPHTGATLAEHLVGTYMLLKAWNNADYVCEAGLFHSIYGTASFHSAVLSAASRTSLRDLIGDRAEALVFAFHTTDWTSVLRNPSLCADLERAHKGISEIAIANLVEQMSRVASITGNHSGCLEAAKTHLALVPWVSDKAHARVQLLIADLGLTQ